MRSANYIEETTTSIAGAGGIGAVTLTAVSGLPRFSSAFGTQTTTVRYVIEDTVNKTMETGTGAVSSNVLTRVRPQITWNGTTYDDSTPSPLAFGASPTAGNIKIRIAATAESQGVVMPGFITGSITGRDATWGEYPLSAHMAPWSNAGSNSTFSANSMRYQYVQFDQAGLLTGVQVDCTAPGVASIVKHGLYPVRHDGYPGALICTFNDFDCAATGIKTDTAVGTWSIAGGVWMTPGWYVWGFKSGGNVVGLRVFSNANSAAFGKTPVGRTSSYAGYKGLIAGESSPFGDPLPAQPDMTGAAIATSQQVWVGFRVES